MFVKNFRTRLFFSMRAIPDIEIMVSQDLLSNMKCNSADDHLNLPQTRCFRYSAITRVIRAGISLAVPDGIVALVEPQMHGMPFTHAIEVVRTHHRTPGKIGSGTTLIQARSLSVLLYICCVDEHGCPSVCGCTECGQGRCYVGSLALAPRHS